MNPASKRSQLKRQQKSRYRPFMETLEGRDSPGTLLTLGLPELAAGLTTSELEVAGSDGSSSANDFRSDSGTSVSGSAATGAASSGGAVGRSAASDSTLVNSASQKREDRALDSLNSVAASPRAAARSAASASKPQAGVSNSGGIIPGTRGLPSSSAFNGGNGTTANGGQGHKQVTPPPGSSAARGVPTNQWVVQLKAGSNPRALASKMGATYVKPAPNLANTHVLEFNNGRSASQVIAGLKSRGVVSAVQLYARQQVARFTPNDPLFSREWHLNNTGQTNPPGTVGEDVNVTEAWDVSRGKGVVVSIVDDGTQWLHPDLKTQYVPEGSYDFNDDDNNPAPDQTTDFHGTAVAGVAVGRGNNGVGVSGAAPSASLSAIRLIAAPTTELDEAEALSYQRNINDIYNNSWGPPDLGNLGPNWHETRGFGILATPGIGSLAEAALRNGATKGRDGLGNIFVWAGGNGRANSDNSNYDAYANSRYVLAVASVDENGVFTSYSEPGANVFVSTPSGGNGEQITTTDLVGTDGYNPGGTANDYADDDYTNTFNGTSSSAPLAAGLIALILGANPNLTRRDVEHILARTARQNDPFNGDWTTNGAGFHVNHNYGFGVIDAKAAVDLAVGWQNVGREVSYKSPRIVVNRFMEDPDPTTGLTQGGPVTSRFRVPANITIERVEVVFNATTEFRGDVKITLTSPEGTTSILAEQRLTDDVVDPETENGNYNDWKFTTVHNWGESSKGVWTIRASDEKALDLNLFNSWKINIYGTRG